MLEHEVTDSLQRWHHERTEESCGYRKGHAPERTIGVGLGAIPVRVPRVRDVPTGVSSDGFQSQIVRRYQRLSEATQHLEFHNSRDG